MTNAPPLTSADPAWRPLKSWLLSRIHVDQRQLEASGLTAQQYDVHRGRIAAFREIINTVEPTKLLTAEQIEVEDHYNGD